MMHGQQNVKIVITFARRSFTFVV